MISVEYVCIVHYIVRGWRTDMDLCMYICRPHTTFVIVKDFQQGQVILFSGGLIVACYLPPYC